MDEKIMDLLEEELRNYPSDEDIKPTEIVNNISSVMKRDLEFKEITEILKIIEPQTKRNVLKLLYTKGR